MLPDALTVFPRRNRALAAKHRSLLYALFESRVGWFDGVRVDQAVLFLRARNTSDKYSGASRPHTYRPRRDSSRPHLKLSKPAASHPAIDVLRGLCDSMTRFLWRVHRMTSAAFVVTFVGGPTPTNRKESRGSVSLPSLASTR